ncbi:Regulatory protein PchR [Sporomusa ovata DSM 2662]|uniref:Transcriptional regulator, AraC family n=1 Tax=Sporomusa ovata TaxID=2378 RepID=A0A0U1L2I5_9FIRM|nr:helix-turn-helix domain-containing protein [Sporomusa ovata]EQB25325.1 AraC family transcriptional regulator [Sporomusa ovata DSM 2662]CQR73891.1 Transcriptional regulator, AraC family [Sporomusa ovata]
MHGLKTVRKNNNEIEEHWVIYNNRRYLMHSSPNSMNYCQITKEFGSGYVQQLLVCPFAQIKDFEFTFCDSLCGGANYTMPRLVLYFCLNGELVLEEKGITVDPSHFLAFGATDLRRVLFQPNFRHRVITVEIYPDKLRDFSSGAYLFAALRSLQAPNKAFSTHKLSPAMKTILYQLLHCPNHDPVRTLYMEGKLLECMSVYLNETICQQEPMLSRWPNLSRQDIKSFYEAKQILDQNFVSPPTLAGLSKLICLNEFKLKQGFKQLFGQTVHTYVVNKRLELAKQLFEEKNITVGEAASYIGYSNASYFALAFRKKFGINPSEYRSHKE